MTCKTDNHMHPFEKVRKQESSVIKNRLREFIEAARRRGFEEITFTEHCPLLKNISEEEFDNYVSLTLEVINETETPRVKLGIELDYHPERLQQAESLIARYPFEYILGTVHIHTELYREEIIGKSYDQAIEMALEMTRQAVATGLFDAIAHLDFFRWLNDRERFGNWHGTYQPGRYQENFMEILNTMAKTGTALEVNASGLRKRFASVLPGEEILQWADSIDSLTYIFGSDAHLPERVGDAYEETIAALSPAQRQKLVTFRDRVPIGCMMTPVKGGNNNMYM